MLAPPPPERWHPYLGEILDPPLLVFERYLKLRCPDVVLQPVFKSANIVKTVSIITLIFVTYADMT